MFVFKKAFSFVVLAFIVLTMTCSLTQADEPNIPEGAVLNTLNGHYYYVYHEKMTPQASQNFCEQQGGYLVTITSQEEQDFVHSIAANSGISLITLGGTDDGHEGTWEWMNGEEWTSENWDIGYDQREPNNGYGAGQNYLQMYSDRGVWDDFYGGWDNFTDIKDGFICEWDGTSIDLKIEALERAGFGTDNIICDMDVATQPV